MTKTNEKIQSLRDAFDLTIPEFADAIFDADTDCERFEIAYHAIELVAEKCEESGIEFDNDVDFNIVLNWCQSL